MLIFEQLVARGLMAFDPNRKVLAFNLPALAKFPAIRQQKMEEFKWLIGEWAFENRVHATPTTPAYTDTYFYAYNLSDDGTRFTVSGHGAKARPYLAFDPFSNRWMMTFTEGLFGVLQSNGWQGDAIVFTGLLTMLGVDCELRQTITKKSSDEFHILNEEKLRDETWRNRRVLLPKEVAVDISQVHTVKITQVRASRTYCNREGVKECSPCRKGWVRGTELKATPKGAKERGLLRAHARQQRQFPPLPLAIYICESNLAQPTKLCLHVQQLVRRIFRLHGETNTVQKFLVQPLSWRRHMFQITKHPTSVEQAKYFRRERPLPLMYQVMDGETRDHRIKAAQCGHRIVHVVFNNFYGSVADKPLSRGVEHCR